MGVRWSRITDGILGTERASKNRKRRLDVELDDDDDEEPPRKRQRRSISTVWNSFSDTMTTYFAKAFLFAAEMTARKAKSGELAKEKDLIQALLQLLEYFQGSDIEILRRGWRVLCACTDDNDSYIPISTPEVDTLESDIATVITAMRIHTSSIKIQLLGFRALRTLVIKNGEKWDLVCKTGGISVFIQAMKTFPDDICVQGLAITFLAMVVREVGDIPRSEVLELEGTQLILDAMHKFDDERWLLHSGCYALHQIGFIRVSKGIILEKGGIGLLVRALEQHMTDESLVDLCLSALSKLSDEDRVFENGLVPLILRCMQKWPGEQSIQGHSLVLLLRAAGREPIPAQASIKLIIKAMKSSEDSASLQFFACAALREILQRVRNQDAFDLLIAEGGVECILAAVKKHQQIFGLQPMALLLLMHIFEERRHHQQAVASAFGGSDHAIAIMTGLRMEGVDAD